MTIRPCTPVSIRARGLFRAILGNRRACIVGDRVSIRARGLFRAIQPRLTLKFQDGQVSIRARGLFRAIQGANKGNNSPKEFQSAPGVYSGRYFEQYGCRFFCQDVSIRARGLFRAIPPQEQDPSGCILVSIRARGLFRAILTAGARSIGLYTCFNPRPGFIPGDTIFFNIDMIHLLRSFNPRPGFIPGDTRCGMDLWHSSTSFNPRPGFIPGDTSWLGTHTPPDMVVSIRARGLFRAIQVDPEGQSRNQRVSIRARGLFRAIQDLNRIFTVFAVCFNPRPGFIPGDTHPSSKGVIAGSVSIRARGLFRAIPVKGCFPSPHEQVSIRARGLFRAILYIRIK